MILVTGATGLLGSAIVESLLKKGEKVRALVRNKSDLKQLKPFEDKVDIVQGDVLDMHSLEEATAEVKQIYHCAAIVSFDPNQKDLMHQINVEGTANIVNVALEKGIEKLLHVSSIAALGRVKNGAIVTESTQWQNTKENSQYAISKYLSEIEIWRGIAEGLNAVIVNPSIILGKGNWKNDSSALFNIGFQKIPFYPAGVNGFVDQNDVVKASIELMESSIVNERFILSGADISYKDLFTWMAQNYGHNIPRYELKNWMGQLAWRLEKIRTFINGKTPVITKETIRTTSNKYSYSSQKLKQAIGFKFTPAKETIDRISQLYLEETKTS